MHVHSRLKNSVASLASVTGIHGNKGVDGRNKSGHDDVVTHSNSISL
jgi:hypothetical protein